MTTLRERAHFLKHAVLDPQVAAVTVSSRYVVNNVLRRIAKRIDLIIEYGPGQGVMTQALLPRLSSHGRLIAIESNHEFVTTLARIRDPRIEVIQGNVQDVIPALKKRGISDADLVVSSIPFSFIKTADRIKIIKDTHDLLGSQGSFIVYQYSPLMYKPLKQFFTNVSLTFEPRNFLPYFIMHAKKNSS